MRLLWILIPLAAIALAGFAEWLKFRRHTASLGESNLELSASIDALNHEIGELRQEKALLVQRIRNLETIVTSEAWDTLTSDPELSRASIPEMPAESVNDEEKVQRLARRLRG